MLITCDKCRKRFNRKPSQVKIRQQHFCSKECRRLGFVFSKELRKRIAETVSKVNTGKKRSVSTCRNIALSKQGSKNPNWKGDMVGYKGLHGWINYNWGGLKKCEQCGTTSAKKFEWANLNGVYNRDRKNWKRMCCSCHDKYDKTVNNFTKNKNI